jgi:hypothetical protein
MSKSQDIAQEKLKESFRKIEEDNVDTWTNDYLSWLSKQGVKKRTKQNIKQYFKEIKIKVSDTTIDKIKTIANL